MVLIDASSRSCSTDPVGFVNRRLYTLAKSNPEDFNDVTSGNNGYYPATSGYDMVTSLRTRREPTWPSRSARGPSSRPR